MENLPQDIKELIYRFYNKDYVMGKWMSITRFYVHKDYANGNFGDDHIFYGDKDNTLDGSDCLMHTEVFIYKLEYINLIAVHYSSNGLLVNPSYYFTKTVTCIDKLPDVISQILKPKKRKLDYLVHFDSISYAGIDGIYHKMYTG